MADLDITISELDLVGAVDGTLQIAADDSNNQTVKLTVNQLAGYIRELAEASIPDRTGEISDFAFNLTSYPETFENFIICDGRNLARVDYPELFAKIGTTWGEGDGSTTFTIPNALDRYKRSKGTVANTTYQEHSTAATGLSFVGTAKAPTATFAGAAMPAHNHSATFAGAAMPAHNHSATFAGAAMPAHSHFVLKDGYNSGAAFRDDLTTRTLISKDDNDYTIAGAKGVTANNGLTNSASAGTPSGNVTNAGASAGTPSGNVTNAGASAGTPSGTVAVAAYTPEGAIKGSAETRPQTIVTIPYIQFKKLA